MADTSPNTRRASQGWMPFRARTLGFAAFIALPFIAYLSFREAGLWISFGVLALIGFGLALSIDQRGLFRPRILSSKRLTRVRESFSKRRPRRPLNHRGRIAVALVEADQSGPAIQNNQDAKPSRSWQKRKDDAWMLKLLGLITWAALVLPALNSFYNQLGPYWHHQSKGFTHGIWLCLILLALSIVPLLPTLSFIDRHLAQR